MRRSARATSIAPPVERDAFDLVTIHQVLHYLDDPATAIREAARLLRPGGRLVIVDFAPHALEFLREEHAHVRLGFSDRQIADWFAEAGLDLEETQEFEPRGDGRRKADRKAVARPRPPHADCRSSRDRQAAKETA